jgi:hypothetical protein
MTLKPDLPMREHPPENLPPTFRTEDLGNLLALRGELFSRGKSLPALASNYRSARRKNSAYYLVALIYSA